MRSKTSTFLYYLLTAAALIWMAVIFLKSAQTYQQQSLRPQLTQWLAGVDLPGILPHWEFSYDHDLVTWRDPIGFIEFFIRKAGHVSEYAVLALLWSLALLAKRIKAVIALLTSSIISILYACTDEWHQTFVPDRTGLPIDIAVDAIGVAVALIIILIGIGVRNWIKRRKIS
ncbi:VanZ family protein [Paenibacillus aestuarii]|uniref:VanZ family protein n=1 Tax=Paenibacillus aestuarii TaxID=516965 RepID=A0ABW0KFD1_9BACL|nr:VanZ family protein [Paenibacillus aestuarii]